MRINPTKAAKRLRRLSRTTRIAYQPCAPILVEIPLARMGLEWTGQTCALPDGVSVAVPDSQRTSASSESCSTVTAKHAPAATFSERELAEFAFFYGRAGTGGLEPLIRIIIGSVQIALVGTQGEPQ